MALIPQVSAIRIRGGMLRSGCDPRLTLRAQASGQAFVLRQIPQLGLPLLIAGGTNPPVDSDFAELPDRPVAAGAAESLLYFADHVFLSGRGMRNGRYSTLGALVPHWR